MSHFFQCVGLRFNRKVGVVVDPDPVDPDPVDPPVYTGDPYYEEGIPMQTVALPNDSNEAFIEASGAMVGAVTADSFQVKAKMSAAGKARLVAYKDEAMTQPVAYSDLVTTNLETATVQGNTVELNISGLNAMNKLYWSINSAGQKTAVNGSCKTMPSIASSFRLISTGCGRGYYHGNAPAGQGLENRFESSVSNTPMFDYIMKHYSDALYFVHNGDLHYGDANIWVDEFDVYREYDDITEWADKQARVYRNIPISYSWDDHDYLVTGRTRIPYSIRMPHHTLPDEVNNGGAGIYHTFTIGRVRIIQLDMRTYRNVGGGVSPEEKTILGATQLQWLKDTLIASDSLINVINVGGPWTATSGSDNWIDDLVERQKIIDFIRENHLDGITVLLAGDFHGLAFDNGHHSEGIPFLHCGSIDSSFFEEDDPQFPDQADKHIRYTSEFAKGSDQFADFNFLEDGINIDLTVRGLRARYGEDGGEVVKMTHNQLFSKGDIDILTQDGSSQNNNFTFQFEERATNNIADYYIVTVDNIPQASVEATGAKVYSLPLTLEGTNTHKIEVLNVKEVQLSGVKLEKAYPEEKIIGKSSPITVTANGTSITYDADWQSTLDYATSQGIALPDEAQRFKTNQTILAYKSVKAWDKSDTFFYFKGTAVPAFKLICIKRRIQAIANGTLSWSELGVEGDGATGWINTQFNPSIGVNRYLRDSASIMYVGAKADDTDAGTTVAAYDGTGYTRMAVNRDAGVKIFYINGGIAESTGPNAVKGLNMFSRHSATSFLRGVDKKPDLMEYPSTPVPNANFTLLAFDNRGSLSGFSNEIMAIAAIGSNMSTKYNLLRKILE